MKQDCPACGVDIQVQTMVPKGCKHSWPIPGICLNCIALVVIDEDLSVRKPTPEEAMHYSKSNGLWNLRFSLRSDKQDPAKPLIYAEGRA